MPPDHTAEKYAGGATAAEPGFLCGVFDDELEWRERSRRERLPRRARFPVPKSFEGCDRAHAGIPDEPGRESLESASFVSRRQNLVPCGGVGNGKTHMAIACGVAACRAGLTVVFPAVSDLVMRMSAEGGAERASGEAGRADLVILDELGYLPIDQNGARLPSRVVSRCYERRSMIAATNLEFSRWGSVPADDQMAAATVDRIIHYGHLLVFDGPTRRTRESPMRAAARKREN